MQHPFDGIVQDESTSLQNQDTQNASGVPEASQVPASRRSFFGFLAGGAAALGALFLAAPAAEAQWRGGYRGGYSHGGYGRGGYGRGGYGYGWGGHRSTGGWYHRGHWHNGHYHPGHWHGGGRVTTYALGEEGSGGGTVTTYALGEEGRW